MVETQKELRSELWRPEGMSLVAWARYVDRGAQVVRTSRVDDIYRLMDRWRMNSWYLSSAQERHANAGYLVGAGAELFGRKLGIELVDVTLTAVTYSELGADDERYKCIDDDQMTAADPELYPPYPDDHPNHPSKRLVDRKLQEPQDGKGQEVS